MLSVQEPSKKDSSEKSASFDRRSDDALVHALSLVLTANGEYAKSVSSLLENDLQKQQSLDELKKLITNLITATNVLINAQNDALKTIEEFSDAYYKDDIKESLVELFSEQRKEMDKKFTKLFVENGLKEDGTEYSPADKIIIKLKKVLGNQLWILVSGIILYQLMLALIRKFGTGH